LQAIGLGTDEQGFDIVSPAVIGAFGGNDGGSDEI